ncbi:hypothetical protein B296_00019153 [Ensete ventricosum]|uniref:Uncharacterized protein n=1 Tax=Ensete ventricosum TaxID=4639 RepID=A0A426YMK6_ENSVE|nr:hypothetical protein B296_00019153 [Ensete ventricosum]
MGTKEERRNKDGQRVLWHLVRLMTLKWLRTTAAGGSGNRVTTKGRDSGRQRDVTVWEWAAATNLGWSRGRRSSGNKDSRGGQLLRQGRQRSTTWLWQREEEAEEGLATAEADAKRREMVVGGSSRGGRGKMLLFFFSLSFFLPPFFLLVDDSCTKDDYIKMSDAMVMTAMAVTVV